jgi:hypothetical protein
LNIGLNINESQNCRYNVGGHVWEGGGGMEDMKVREHYGWTSYTYMKQNKETSCNYSKWGGEGVERESWWG